MNKEEKFKEKRVQIKKAITELDNIKEELFRTKDLLYGDFKYNEQLKKPPYPIEHINNAISSLELAIEEANIIEINSI